MKILDLTFPSPHENLACDEALVDACEDGNEGEILRFWESAVYFAVLGYSNRFSEEINANSAEKERVPVLRRCSGGGTVLQGPGCLNYSLILRIEPGAALDTIASANRFVMDKQKSALALLLGEDVKVQGVTDLTLGPLKFSGNAQRRKSRFLLFHGTFLVNFDIPYISKILAEPPKQPLYRKKRPHTEFLTNVSVSRNAIKRALEKTWGAKNPADAPEERMRTLCEERYTKDEWNLKF